MGQSRRGGTRDRRVRESGVGRRRASVVWRESWGIHEYVLYEAGLGVHGGPRYAAWEANWQRSRGRYLADGKLACISYSRIALLRSLILSEVHLATGGRVQVSPGYWMY